MPDSHFLFDNNGPVPEKFDVLVATCGYESRSVAVAQTRTTDFARVVAYTYPEHKVHSYEQNLEYYATIGELRHPRDLSAFATQLETDLRASLDGRDVLRVAIDISSFNRERLGAIVHVLADMGAVTSIDVCFVYAMASFDSHQEAIESMVLVNGPMDGFEGWTRDPSTPVACVVGLGFENLIALAALETLEPARTVAFVARSDDERFQERVLRDNAPLLGSNEVKVIHYDVDRPFESLHALEGVVHALESDFRVVLVPLGPKLFALHALLVAWEYRETVAVWRVSSDQAGSVEDRQSNGKFVEFHVRVRPQLESVRIG